MKYKLGLSALFLVALVVSACGTATSTVVPVGTASSVPGLSTTSTPLGPITGSTATLAPVTGSTATLVPVTGSTATMAPVATTPPAMATTPPTGNVVPVTGASGPATINLGPFLVNSMGMALYVNSKDTPNTSTCTGACATVWLPVLTVGTPLVGDNMGGASTLGTPTVGTPMVATPAVGASTGFMGLNASLLGTANRADGTVQVTYNGWPLYTYSQDLKVGDIKGQGFNSQWYLITADGNMAK